MLKVNIDSFRLTEPSVKEIKYNYLVTFTRRSYVHGAVIMFRTSYGVC